MGVRGMGVRGMGVRGMGAGAAHRLMEVEARRPRPMVRASRSCERGTSRGAPAILGRGACPY
eukprot:4688184-Prymnesium_polylepis.1